MKWTALDGGLIGFDRDSGENVLHAGEATRSLVRRAPRTLQVGLLTPCNLSCAFCYRDATAPSLLDRAFVVDLLQKADRWGVVEAAFGGGEPLLFEGFVEMIEELHRTTKLGLDVTTNGLLLTREVMTRLHDRIGEVRLSVYPDNDWASTLARHRDGGKIGLNWLVTPANVGDVGARVRDFFRRGARNVLLLGYKGRDRSMILDDGDIATLEREIAGLDGLPILLDICLYPRLPRLPHLFRRTDCGAGDDMLAITADRAVQACSFADRRIPFATFEDLRSIWGILRAAKPPANVAGCTRARFGDAPDARVVSGRVLPMANRDSSSRTFAWRAHASSNSGPYTLLARFRDIATAEKLEAMLDDAYQAHLDFVVGQSVEERSSAMYAPTPPLVELGRAHGFTWPADDGFAWEGDAFGDRAEADALEIERFGRNVIVHLHYGQQMGEKGIEHLCALLGAERVVSIEMEFRVVVTPKTPAAAKKLEATLARAISDLEEDYLAFDSARAENVEVQSLDETRYQIEVRLESGTRQLGFASNIGGYCDASKLVVTLSGLSDVDFQLRGGRVPQRVEDAANAWRQPTEPLVDAAGGGKR